MHHQDSGLENPGMKHPAKVAIRGLGISPTAAGMQTISGKHPVLPNELFVQEVQLALQ